MSEAAYHTEQTIWITDAELIRRMGVPEKIARSRLRMLDADRRSGFPQKNKFWGNRRNWLHCKAYFERNAPGSIAGFKRRTGHDD
jgi:hypothetical protein